MAKKLYKKDIETTLIPLVEAQVSQKCDGLANYYEPDQP